MVSLCPHSGVPELIRYVLQVQGFYNMLLFVFSRLLGLVGRLGGAVLADILLPIVARCVQDQLLLGKRQIPESFW